MSSKIALASIREVVARRVWEARKHKAMTQEQLAKRLTELGFTADRTAVLKIEKGTRGVSIEEAFALAAALDVLPVHLFAPLTDETVVSVTTEHEVPAEHLRGWIRGSHFLPGSSTRAVASQMPESELRQLFLSRIATATSLTADERSALKSRRREIISHVEQALGYSASEAIADAIAETTRTAPTKRRRRKEKGDVEPTA